MKSPVKEGQMSPIRSPAHSPARKPKPHTSPGKAEGKKSRSPHREEKRAPSPQHIENGAAGYDDDFEEATQEDLSSLEEELREGKIYVTEVLKSRIKTEFVRTH